MAIDNALGIWLFCTQSNISYCQRHGMFNVHSRKTGNIQSVFSAYKHVDTWEMEQSFECPKRAHVAIIMSLWRRNDVMTSVRRQNDVILHRAFPRFHIQIHCSTSMGEVASGCMQWRPTEDNRVLEAFSVRHQTISGKHINQVPWWCMAS